jgi:Lysozyme like domain
MIPTPPSQVLGTHYVTPTGQVAAARPAVPYVTMLRYAYNAGFRGLDLTKIVAIAQAESSGIPNATDGYAYGLTQIDSRYHPNAIAALDPQTAFDKAYQLYMQAGQAGKDPFSPWTMYNNGGYKANILPVASAGSTYGSTNSGPMGAEFVTAGRAAAAFIASGGAPGNSGNFPNAPDILAHPPSLPSIPNPIDGVTGAIGGFTSAVSGLFVRGLWVLGGITALLIGAYLLVKGGETSGGSSPNVSKTAEAMKVAEVAE